MKLAISNIAWPSEAVEEMLLLVRAVGCDGVEIAPTRVWDRPAEAGADERRSLRSLLERQGLRAAALHSLLWGRDDLGFFRAPTVEAATVEYLCALVRLTADLGAGVLVFGSPQGRRRGGMPLEAAFARAAEFFRRPAEAAAEAGVALLIEPLTSAESDFINTLAEGRRLVDLVASPGFGLHVDAKSLAAEGDSAAEVLLDAAGRARHFHVNDPGLGEVGAAAYHAEFGAILRRASYAGYVSIEMKTLPDYRGAVERSLRAASRHYLGRWQEKAL